MFDLFGSHASKNSVTLMCEILKQQGILNNYQVDWVLNYDRSFRTDGDGKALKFYAMVSEFMTYGEFKEAAEKHFLHKDCGGKMIPNAETKRYICEKCNYSASPFSTELPITLDDKPLTDDLTGIMESRGYENFAECEGGDCPIKDQCKRFGGEQARQVPEAPLYA